MSEQSIFFGKTALITGAASGMGRATAEMLAADGAEVALLDRDAKGLKSVATSIGLDRAEKLVADLSNIDEIDTAVQRALERFGKVDFLLNIAGYRHPVDTTDEVDANVWEKTYAINVIGPARLMQKCAEAMIKKGEGGRIVNVSSSSAFRATGVIPYGYACSKAAVNQMTRAAAGAYGRYNINVNTVVPGATLTALAERQGVADKLEEMCKEGPMANLLGRVSLPEDVAGLIRFLCLPESRQITGQTLHVSAGLIL